MMAMASANLLRKLLPVVDDFDRAAETLPDGLEQETWLEGILIIKHKLGLLLDSEGVEPIDTAGQTFDPRYHEAVTYEQVEGYEEGQIIAQVQPGYMLGNRVLRPALVRVAQAPVAQSEVDIPDEEIDEIDVAEEGGKE
jgi:molecular chaperone GrpE